MNKTPIFANGQKLLEGFYIFLDSNLKKFGRIYKYRGLLNFYFVSDPDELKKILVNQNSDYKRVTKYNRVVQSVFSKDNLFFSDADEWSKKRKMMNPFFAKKNVKTFHHIMKKNVAEIIKEIEYKVTEKGGKSVDIFDISNYMVVKIVMNAFFTKKLDKNEFSEIIIWINELRDYLGQIPYPIISNPKTPTYANIKIKKTLKRFNKFITKLIKDRINDDDEYDDLLSCIIKMYSKKNASGKIDFDEEAIIKEIYLAIFAGYETSSATITWIFYTLAENQDKYEILQREIDHAFKEKSIDTDEIMKLKYLDQVLNEVLRIRTAPWVLGRTSKKELEISGETVKKNSMVILCPHFAHHDEKYWQDPNQFIPERWDENNTHNINKNSFMPFGAGPRKCIGMEFSIAEMKIIMVMMLLKFNFSLDPNFKIKTGYGLTAYPEGGLKMILKIKD